MGKRWVIRKKKVAIAALKLEKNKYFAVASVTDQGILLHGTVWGRHGIRDVQGYRLV